MSLITPVTEFLGRFFAQPDKALHAGVGAITQSALRVLLPVTVALAIAALLGWGKERYDKAHPPGDAEGWDAFATVAGAIAAEVVWSAASYILMR